MLPKLPAGHFLGRTLNARAWAGFRLTETAYAPGLRLPRHAHELAKYCFVLAGSFEETSGRRKQVRQPLALAFQPPDTTHEEVHDAQGRHFLVELEGDWLARAREYSAILDQPVDLQGGASLRLATQLYDEFRRLDNVSPLAMEGLILELMAETSRRALGRTERQMPHWLEQLEELLRVRFAENPSLQELSAAVNVHEVHLARVFRKFHGCTVGDFLRRLRIEDASRRLSTTDEGLAEIAAAAGFADQSHFSRTFKSRTGMQPTAFRAMFKSVGR